MSSQDSRRRTGHFRDPELEIPEPRIIQRGTGYIHRLFRAPDGTIRLLVQGIARFRVIDFIQFEPNLKAEIELSPEEVHVDLEVEALSRSARDQFAHIAEMITTIPRELVASVQSLEEPLQTVYTIANFQRMDLEAAQQILEFDNVLDKLKKLVGILTREVEVLEIGQKIQSEARSEIEKMQREYFLREQLKAIQRELGEGDEQAAEVEELRQKIQAAQMSEEAEKQARRELDLSRLPTAAAEYSVSNLSGWLFPALVYRHRTTWISYTREVLDQDHYSLEDIMSEY
jgi:ATP-dependent Lon protease